MPSVLGSLFSKPDPVPTMPELDINGILKQGSSYNQGLLNQFQQYAPGQATFMQNLFNTLSPQVQQAQNQNFSLGTQLATQGFSNAQKGALDYYRQLGLQTAAATGAPLSSQYAQNLGGSIGVQSVLQNQEAGAGLLNQTAQFQNQLSNQDLTQANSTLQANQINPTSLFAPSEYNNQIQGQNALIDYSNSQSQSWFDTLLSKTLGSVVSTPFNFIQSGSSVVGNSPQLFASMFAGSAAMQGGPNSSSGGGITGSGTNVTGSGGGGGGSGGIFSSLLGAGGASGGMGAAACCFIMMEAYHGNMPSWVRECRDEFAPQNSARRKGYIRMARWLVPAMRISAIVRSMVWHLMIVPLTLWGGFYKKEPGFEKYGHLRPVVAFWFSVWERMGS